MANGRVGTATSIETVPPALPGQRARFDDHFDRIDDEARDRLTGYLRVLRPIADRPTPVLDIGCGRGEFLAALRDLGIPAVGIDADRNAVIAAGDRGLDVREADANQFLSTCDPTSFGAITMLRLVDHLPPDVIVPLLAGAFHALVPEDLHR